MTGLMVEDIGQTFKASGLGKLAQLCAIGS
jgi:hypothetical protein